MIKNLLFTALLMPLTLLSNDTETQIKELKFNKEIELSVLGETISEKYAYIECIRQEAISILRNMAKKKQLNEKETKEFGESIDKDLVAFVKKINGAKSIDGFLVKELFKTTENDPIEDDFEAVKFFIVRIINEYRILKTLVQKYEVLEQKHGEIGQKLSDIKK